MCLICKDLAIGNLTTDEASRNLDETTHEEMTEEEIEHFFEVAEKISDKILEKKIAKYTA